jgi:16S rRNA (uracil1498-N3)-methyltransferase
MRLTRAFVDAPLAAGANITLPAAPAAHLTRVLRLRAGDRVVLFNGRGGEYDAQLSAVGRTGVQARIDAHHAVERESALQVTLLQAIARGERMDLVVQKATELGVAAIVPLICERSVVQLDASGGERRSAHWRAVAVAACEQCGRNRLPHIAPVSLFEAACGAAADATRVLLDPAASVPLVNAAAAAGRALTLLIGPEGGLSEGECRLAERSGFVACRLGPRTLRTETAALAALAAVQAVAGDLRA